MTDKLPADPNWVVAIAINEAIKGNPDMLERVRREYLVGLADRLRIDRDYHNARVDAELSRIQGILDGE